MWWIILKENKYDLARIEDFAPEAGISGRDK